jgi:hypothetical protein
VIAQNRSRFDTTIADIDRVQLAERRRTYPERLHRRVSSAIDRACDQVERVNLAGGGECPSAVGTVIAQLQRLAGEEIVRPTTSGEAHEELLRLSTVLLGRSEADVEVER